MGLNLKLYDRIFRITECDEFTKEFFKNEGLELSAADSMPIDNFDVQKQLKYSKIPLPDTKEYKEYFEVKLGGWHPNNGLEKYLKFDRQVLSFDVLWDDRTVEGGLNFF